MQCPVHVKKLEPIVSSKEEHCELCASPATHYCKQCNYVQCS